MNFSRRFLFIVGFCIFLTHSAVWKLHKSEVDVNYTYRTVFSSESTKFMKMNEPNANTYSTLLQKEVSYDSQNDIFHIKISDPRNKHFEVPREIFAEHPQRKSDVFSNGFVVKDKKNPLHFEVLSKKNNTMFTFRPENLTYSQFYLEFSYTLTTDHIFGYGERAHNFKLSPGMYTIWLNDTGTPYDDGQGGKNLYGHHPFILNRVSDGTFFGLLFVNTNAQDLIISHPNNNGTVNLTQKTIGGEIEFFLFRGATPLEVITKYQTKIGFSALPPVWALGWHQCRWGYNNTQQLDEVVQKYRNLSIPLDTMWSDINYMDNYQDFTVDKVNFGNLSQVVNQWHGDNLHYVPIVDIGIAVKNGSYYNDLGKKLNTFIVSNYTKQPLINEVWPGACYFPDFTNPNASILWTYGLVNLSNLVNYDGIWLDMNEPGMFQVGETNFTLDNSRNLYSNIPYIPGGGNINLSGHSCSINALMYGSGDQQFGTMYNYKAYNPYFQNKITSTQLASRNQRPFVLSRASMFGMGVYSSHWLGDNYSTLDSMAVSIPGIFNFQMFGFNLVGADICGFGGNTNDALCSRWIDLGAFYPFSRNHNAQDTIAQEPWALGNYTLTSAYKALRFRYSLIRYIYTQMFHSSSYGGVVFQPIFFQFPNDEVAYNNIDNQFMLGDSLLVSPILNLNENDIEAYFPNANWNEFPSGKNVTDFNASASSGVNVTLPGNFNTLNVHLRGGSILPYQNATNLTRTSQLFAEKTSLYINPDHNNSATGSVVFDDGISFNTISSKNYVYTRLVLQNTTLNFNTINDFPSYNNNDILLNQVIFFRGNLYSEYKNIVAIDIGGNKITLNPTYNSISNTLTLTFFVNVRITHLRSITFS
jgi:lysosomal alpha-glucosidase